MGCLNSWLRITVKSQSSCRFSDTVTFEKHIAVAENRRYQDLQNQRSKAAEPGNHGVPSSILGRGTKT